MAIIKKYKKRYTVSGKIEWTCVITFGQAQMSVPFTGGGLSNGRLYPAEYITSDEITQHIIENSHFFKSGKIELADEYLISTEEVEDEEDEEEGNSGETDKKDSPAPESKEDGQNAPPKEKVKGNNKKKATPKTETKPQVKEVEVANLADAKDYLVDNFGSIGSELTSATSINDEAALHNIKFLFL